MAFGDTVQSNSTSGTTVTSLAVTFSAAVAGNLLVAGFSSNIAQTWGTDPTGWTLIHQIPNATGQLAAIWYYKIAAGGETSVTATFDGSGSNCRGSVAEFEGAFNATPLDVAAESEANISTVVASQASGTTATTAQADELLVAFFASDAIQNVDGGRAYTNSFAEVIAPISPGGRAGATLVKLVVAATGTYSTTFTTTDPGDEQYGSIAAFKKAGAGASIVPIIMALFRRRKI
jgi:hypothetical protein